MVLKANDRRTSCPCHDEFRGPRSDYVRQETKLCEQRLLSAKGCNIVQRDRASGGDGLMFLIRDVHFQKLTDIGNHTSDLEYPGITVHSEDRTITIKNLYHPPNCQHLDTNRMEGLFDDNTIILGDFNAKNTTWGSTSTNARVPGEYWTTLAAINLPILVEIDLKVNYTGVKNLNWNFKKADWSLFENISNNLISQEPISDNLEKEWSHFKHSIFTAAKSSIPRGKRYLVTSSIEPRPSGLESDALTTRLPTAQKLLVIVISDNGHVSVDAREAAEALAQHYANESRLAFSSSDKHFARVTRNQVKSCKDRLADNPLFNVDFTLPELSYALQNLDTNKSPGPDSIPRHFLSHLGILGREKLLYICNLSWKTGKLPRQWKSAIVIPILKRNKNAGLTTSYRPISLTCITCKLMECMVLRRLTHHLHTNNLMPSEQFAFRKGHSTVDQILYFTQCVRDSQNHKPTRRTMAAFLDVPKAFDRVWKYKLLSKCFGVFGIKGKALSWISNFLNSRKFCVNCHATFSDSYKTYQGISRAAF
ncbi:probable RNA-directed DNA polymerase from transposon BS [Trichonephila clavipes]|uniref:Probable RNA-directed DNA polymerase from transposon BS n=1 Tax=Trichonephila clavipes TaxID=2585209 RepID=A0A8X6SJ88_TRICX|nr:probable RNA-directed DNA polymerase from transposon BS [Trichonephila clavipes]